MYKIFNDNLLFHGCIAMNIGKESQEQIDDLKLLLNAYKSGNIKEVKTNM